jgi:two-component system response regulator FixJ
MSHQRKVYVVGRDQEVRRMLTQHVGAVGAEAWPFASGADFLEILDHLAPGCVLLDMDGSDVPGIEILAEMVARQVAWPVIAISGREELQLVIAAMKLGALDFLRMPLSREVLALALAPAWRALERVVEADESRRAAQERVGRLTARETAVLLALLGGRLNKAIAHDFGISVRTVEMHRAHIMAKLEVKSLAEAALLAPQAGLDVPSAAAEKGRQASLVRSGYGGSRQYDQLSKLARRLSS